MLWILPDVVMFLTSLTVYLILNKVTSSATIDGDIEENNTSFESNAYTYDQFIILKWIGNMNCNFLLNYQADLDRSPSILGSGRIEVRTSIGIAKSVKQVKSFDFLIFF